jgi:threonine dehydrogenase-like Zn-dependent dehydrogenase
LSQVALVRTGAGLRERSVPVPPRGVPSVKILRAGVCGTDLQILRGDRPGGAAILGHEGVGELDGEPGRLVVFNPVDAADPERVLGHSYDGIFRSRFPLRGDGDPELVPARPGLPPDLCTLGEPVAAGLYGWDLAGLPAGARVGVWGAGPIGLLHVKLALDRGMEPWLIGSRRSRLEWARSRLFGAGVGYATAAPGSVPELDAAFLCTDRAGAERALGEAAATLREDAVAVLVSAVPDGLRSSAFPAVDLNGVRRRNVNGETGGGHVEALSGEGRRVRLVGHRGTSRRQLLRAMDIIDRDRAFFGALTTHVVDPGAAVGLIADRCARRQQDPEGAELVKIVIRFGEPGR